VVRVVVEVVISLRCTSDAAYSYIIHKSFI
jgi:hypothetical protein